MNKKFFGRDLVAAGICFCLFFFGSSVLARPAWGFLYEVKILDDKGISQLRDENLVNAYVDVLIELEASKTFHGKAGFTPKEYAQYKNLLRYRYNLMKELKKRQLEIPQLEP